MINMINMNSYCHLKKKNVFKKKIFFFKTKTVNMINMINMNSYYIATKRKKLI